jgi:excisionase family DNA binding protein
MEPLAAPVSFPRLAYSLAESEALCGLSRSALYRLIASGQLKTVQLGRRRLVPRAELERLCTMAAPQRLPEGKRRE